MPSTYYKEEEKRRKRQQKRIEAEDKIRKKKFDQISKTSNQVKEGIKSPVEIDQPVKKSTPSSKSGIMHKQELTATTHTEVKAEKMVIDDKGTISKNYIAQTKTDYKIQEKNYYQEAMKRENEEKLKKKEEEITRKKIEIKERKEKYKKKIRHKEKINKAKKNIEEVKKNHDLNHAKNKVKISKVKKNVKKNKKKIEEELKVLKALLLGPSFRIHGNGGILYKLRKLTGKLDNMIEELKEMNKKQQA